MCCGTLTKNSKPVKVAVKLVKKTGQTQLQSDKIAFRGLLSEIKVLSYIEEHKNIIALLGAYTAKLRKGTVLLFLEYCENGSLYECLQRLNETIQINREENMFDPTIAVQNVKTILDEEQTAKFFRWSMEIADGMEFLANKNVALLKNQLVFHDTHILFTCCLQIVHADLATRNILVAANDRLKIADFGLSRRLYDYTHYVKTSIEPLPWRWMALEALTDMEFCEKTDVWSYGITLWEIYSLGEMPYRGLEWTPEFPHQLRKGLRPVPPSIVDKSMHEIMVKCWSVNVDARPRFAEIRKMLANQPRPF